MRWKTSFFLISFLGLLLGGCGAFGFASSKANAEQPRPVKTVNIPEPRLEIVKIGEPYEEGGQKITPSDQVNYDEVGYASWYGDEVRGNKTSNGEVFDPQAITAAHPTLPMPSYVEVTNLDNGRTILVRINDRGPFAKNRIIDLSAGAAQQLGVVNQGQFPVRVRRTNPPEFERRKLQAGGRAAERLSTPPSLLVALRRNLSTNTSNIKINENPTKPKPIAQVPKNVAPPAGVDFDTAGGIAPVLVDKRPVAKPAIVATPQIAPSTGEYYIQIGAFASQPRAQALAKQAGASVIAAGPVWRVRTGPYASENTARAALGAIIAKGYRGARVTR